MKTTINGKEIKLFGRQEISTEFTKVVSGYLANGFIFFYSRASGGTQGEELKADLSNDGGKTVYRIWLFTDRESREGKERRWSDSFYVIKIVVKKYNGADGTFWASKGELVSEKTFYQINDGYNNDTAVYCEDKEDGEAIKDKRSNRWHNSYISDSKELPEKYFRLAMKCVRKKDGWKSQQLKNVTRLFKTKDGYQIHFNNNRYCNF